MKYIINITIINQKLSTDPQKFTAYVIEEKLNQFLRSSSTEVIQQVIYYIWSIFRCLISYTNNAKNN